MTTVGNGPTRFCRSLGLPLERGKLVVDRCLRVRDANHVWALGDAALIPLDDRGENFAPPTSQFAVREAKCLARNLAAALENRELKPFSYEPKGSLASIGDYKGVAQVFGFSFSGLFAWMLWRFLYIGVLPGFSTRLRVALNWMFDYVLPRSIVQVANNRPSGVIVRRYGGGEALFAPGQRIDGFYAVLDGRLEWRSSGPGAKQHGAKILEAGDHWGERLAAGDEIAQGTLTALEDSRVLILRAEDFARLRAAIPGLDDCLRRRIDAAANPK